MNLNKKKLTHIQNLMTKRIFFALRRFTDIHNLMPKRMFFTLRRFTKRMFFALRRLIGKKNLDSHYVRFYLEVLKLLFFFLVFFYSLVHLVKNAYWDFIPEHLNSIVDLYIEDDVAPLKQKIKLLEEKIDLLALEEPETALLNSEDPLKSREGSEFYPHLINGLFFIGGVLVGAAFFYLIIKGGDPSAGADVGQNGISDPGKATNLSLKNFVKELELRERLAKLLKDDHS